MSKHLLDKECVSLCKALNECPGIITISSCCGHGKNPYLIFFRADSLKNLALICYCFDSCHCGCSGWSVVARTDCSMCPVTFMIEGPIFGEYAEEPEVISGVLRGMNSITSSAPHTHTYPQRTCRGLNSVRGAPSPCSGQQCLTLAVGAHSTFASQLRFGVG